MSITHYTKEILDILDLHLTFSEDCFRKEKIAGEMSFVFYGKLTYQAQSCFHCGVEDPQHFVKWGFKTVRYLLNDVSEYKTYLKIKKQRFRCKICGKTFIAASSVADRYCSIARRVKLSIDEKLMEPFSMATIARMKHVSPTTVLRELRRFEKSQRPSKDSLPEVLCFDEFQSVNRVAGAMSFIMMDGQSHQLLDIVANRQLPHLQRYFARYDSQARKHVQFVVSDFYSPYASLVKTFFPNAQLVIDRFHISQHIGRAFQNQRTQVMKRFASKTGPHKHLKKFWKLLQKNAWELDYEQRHWRPSFRAHLTEQDIVDRLLAYSSELRQGYRVYQAFLSAIHGKNQQKFDQLLAEDYAFLPKAFQTVIQTFKVYHQEIAWAFTVPYSNGPLEGLNNHIKVLKRVAYGFRNFQNFRERIFLYRGKYFQSVSPEVSLKHKRKSS